jgi:hypothetical protein
VTPDSARKAFSTSENWVFACMGMAVEGIKLELPKLLEPSMKPKAAGIGIIKTTKKQVYKPNTLLKKLRKIYL